MKTKFSRILGVGLSVMLLASLLVVGAPTSASSLSLGAESDIPKTSSLVLAPASISIVDVAASGDVIYATTNSTTYQLFKSNDGGATWSDISSSTSFPSGVTIKAIDIAADNPEVVAFLHSDNETELSTDGGASWTDLNGPTVYANLNDIAVSSGSTTYVAIAGDNSTPSAELWTLKATAGTSWTAESGEDGEKTYTGVSTGMAVEFSPNFTTDKIINVVTGNGTDADLQVFAYTSSTVRNWNDSITGFESDWANGIPLDTIAGGLAAASIALPSTYLGTDEGERIAFVSIAAVTTTDESIFRVVDTNPVALDTWSDGKPGPIKSIALNDSTGELIAGDYNASQVYSWLTPMSGSSPNAQRVKGLQQPGGAAAIPGVVVAWSGTNAIAGTSGDESCIAVSTDSGYSWTDTALIDTSLTVMSDFAVNADSSKIYLTTYDSTGDTSVWLKDGDWTRIFSQQGNSAASINSTASFLVGIAPENDSVAYISSMNSTNMWVTKDAGLSWTAVPAQSITGGDTVLDFVVESADVVYAIDNDSITKTSNSGASWGTAKRPADSMVTATISLAPNGDVLVGGSDGYVAFSKDNGSTFTRITDRTDTGNIAHVVADKDYADNNIIYVGADNTIERGEATKDKTWVARTPTLPTNSIVMGIGQSDGVVYVLTDNGTNGRVYRALNLQTADNAALALWSYYEGAGERYNRVAGALKISSGPELWAIDTDTPSLESLLDEIALQAPTLVTPTNGDIVPVNVKSGNAYDVTFTWDRYSDTDITGMTLQVATDTVFEGLVYDNDFTGIDSDVVSQVVGPNQVSPRTASFNPGTTYYWRVRVSGTTPAYSPWSETGTFEVETLVEKAIFNIVSPVLGSTGVPVNPTLVWSAYEGAIRYEVAVSEFADFSILEFSKPVDTTFYNVEDTLANSTTYYWRARGVTGEPAKAGLAAPGGPWANGIFTTEAKAVEPAPPVVIEPTPPAPEKEIQIVEVPMPAPAPAIPSYMLWIIIAVGAVLIIALIVLIVRTRRVA
ncbi:WD40/YVTN/BNR-like repeat-containing protein [Chloroflexota bacterium]